MKKLLVTFLMLFSANAFAFGDINGDLYSGTVTAPVLGATVADSGAYSQQNPTKDYAELSFSYSCSALCSLQIGIFNSSGAAVNTITITQLAATSGEFHFPEAILVNGEHLKVVAAAGNTGTVSAMMNSRYIGGY